ncbi:MAG TPA: hypothetical protein VL460_01370 [Caulobacteraceae bacterium]|jgi:hypothetical protein|nr:hypothetical protein [Caulobacteraceae bacterium]
MRILAAIILTMTLSGCGGVIDVDPSGLDPPPGGWQHPGPPF